MRRQYFGQAGHFIAADRCRFHLHTHVNGYCVSTVGEYYPLWLSKDESADEPATIGLGRLYETMVFRLSGNGEDLESYGDLEMTPYNTRDAANDGHERAVCKWAEMVDGRSSQVRGQEGRGSE
jgi:hypothetical protein